MLNFGQQRVKGFGSEKLRQDLPEASFHLGGCSEWRGACVVHGPSSWGAGLPAEVIDDSPMCMQMCKDVGACPVPPLQALYVLQRTQGGGDVRCYENGFDSRAL